MISLAVDVAPPVSSDSQNTPQWLAEMLGYWGLDPCSNAYSHIASHRMCSLDDGQDGLLDPWHTDGIPVSVFCNWPYSKPLPWCERLANHHAAPWCGLGKLDPTTRWHHTVTTCGSWWAPFRKRIKFEAAGNVGVAKFPSFLVWRDWWPCKELLAMLWEPRRERAA